MRAKYCAAYRLIGLVFCVLLFLPAASFHQEDQTVEQDRGSLLELLGWDGPLYDIIYDLEECYDRHMDILEEEERAARAEQEKVYEEFLKRMIELTGERADTETRRKEDALAYLGREIQRMASEYDLQALFPGSAEERFLRCQHHLRMARLRLKTARELNEAYREVLVRRGAEKFFPKGTPEEWDLWQEELDTFECPKSEERPPLRTQIRIPAGDRRPFVLKTFCLDRNKLGPGDGQVLEIFGHASFLGRATLEQQLKDAAAFPSQEIDIQEAIWKESGESGEEEKPPSKAPKPIPSQRSDSSGGSASLADAVSSGEIDADLRTRDDFSSVEVWLENTSGEEKLIDVSGTVFGAGDPSLQRLVAVGIDTEQPPPGPYLAFWAWVIEDIREEVAKKLEEALERVRNGDHSQEALKELLEAMAAARNVGEESLDEAWNVFRDGLWEETVQSYEDYKANPNKDNRTELIENLETVRQVDPPEGKQEEFSRMLEDIFGVPKPAAVPVE